MTAVLSSTILMEKNIDSDQHCLAEAPPTAYLNQTSPEPA